MVAVSVITCQSPVGQLRMLGWLGSHCQNLGLEVVPSADSWTRGVWLSFVNLPLPHDRGSLCRGKVAMDLILKQETSVQAFCLVASLKGFSHDASDSSRNCWHCQLSKGCWWSSLVVSLLSMDGTFSFFEYCPLHLFPRLLWIALKFSSLRSPWYSSFWYCEGKFQWYDVSSF